MKYRFFYIFYIISLLFSNYNNQKYLILNELDIPDLDINQKFIDNFDYLDLQFDDLIFNSFQKVDSLQNFISSNMAQVKELGLFYNVNYILYNKIIQNEGRFNLKSQLYGTRSGGLIKERDVDLIDYFNGNINEIYLWIGELTGGIKNEWKENRNSILFPNIDEIVYKKTPIKSALRSMILPGWGHFYSNKKLYALIWFTSELSLGIISYLSFRNYQNSRNSYLLNLELYHNSNNEKEVANYRGLAEQDWENHKMYSELAIFCVKIIGVGWITNTLHAWIVGPRPSFKIYKKW